MKILDLTNLEKSDIKYKISKFPDGQQQVTIISINGIESWSEYEFGESLLSTNTMIKSRLNNWLDLELIVCATKSLKELGIDEIQLYVPYIVGARSDDKFEEGSNYYLRDVICPIINSLKFSLVTCIDPHSLVLANCINNFNKLTNKDLVTWSLQQIIDNGDKSGIDIEDHCILVSPDAGASKKIYKLAEKIGYNEDIITCSKDRDKDGKLSKVNVPYDKTLGTTNKDLIIIDDICDGGATFINIAKTIKESGMFYGKIYLIVTHGIFSKGFQELSKYFDGIYCTNSYKDIKMKEGTNEEGFVKQLNVF